MTRDSFDWDSVKYLQLKEMDKRENDELKSRMIKEPSIDIIEPKQSQKVHIQSNQLNAVEKQPSNSAVEAKDSNEILNTMQKLINKPKNPSPLREQKNTITVETIHVVGSKKQNKRVVRAIEDQDLDVLFGPDDYDELNSKSNHELHSKNHQNDSKLNFINDINMANKSVNKVDKTSNMNAVVTENRDVFHDQLNQIFDIYTTTESNDRLENGDRDIEQIFGEYGDSKSRSSLDNVMDLISKTNRLDSQCATFTKKSIPVRKDSDSTNSIGNQDKNTLAMGPRNYKPTRKLKTLKSKFFSNKSQSLKIDKRASLPIQEIENIFDLISRKHSFDDQCAVFTKKDKKLDSISESIDESFTDDSLVVPYYEEFPRIEDQESSVIDDVESKPKKAITRTKTLTLGWKKLKNRLKIDTKESTEGSDGISVESANSARNMQSSYQSLATIQDNSATSSIGFLETPETITPNQPHSPLLSKRISLIFGLDAPIRTVETTMQDRKVTAVYQSDSDSDSDEFHGRDDWM